MGSIMNSSGDIWNSINYGLPSALYFYYLDENLPDYDSKDSDVLGNCSAIQSVQYVPFINKDDLDLLKVPYDVERFGDIDKTRPSLINTPNVYRIIGDITGSKTLKTFKKYDVNKAIGGYAHYKNESRLYNYPFAFAMLNDHLNPPMEIKYHLCESEGNTATVKVKATISDRCSYGLYVEKYKGDTTGRMEAMVSGDAHELPCSSSAYSQWYASSKNQTQQVIKDVSNNSFLTKETASKMLIPNMIGTMASTSLNPMSIIGSGANMLGQGIQYGQTNKRADLDIQQAIQGKIAQSKDLRSTPNTMLSMGSDVYYGIRNGNKRVSLYRYGLEHEQLVKLGNYFAMFGYKQNKVMTIDVRNRYYYNYIKTVGCNLVGLNIPREHLDTLKGIFDKGTTLWHYDRKGVQVGDYSMDNYEVEKNL